MVNTCTQSPDQHLCHELKKSTGNSEIFARILFSRITLKDIFATFKIFDLDILNLQYMYNI